MEPWKSWALVGVFGIGAAYYYSQSGKSKRARGRAPPIVSPEQNQRRGSVQRNGSKDKRKKKSKVSDTSDHQGSDVADVSSASVQNSSNGTVKKRKGGKKGPSKLAQSSAVEVNPEQGVGTQTDNAEDEGMDNKEFARQLSGLKTGISLTKAAIQNETRKAKKQGKRNEAPPQAVNGSALKINGVANSQDMSTASSTTGADADDDLSPAMSPDLRATQATTPSGMDVSDMLEPAPKGPSILRITEPVNPQTIRQPETQNAKPEPETKKQRQNRKKNEEKKAMREQAEKERRTLLEKQLRTAREAEGRPAKNGLGPGQLPSTNVWNKPASAGSDSTGVATQQSSTTLLDTLEDAPTTGLSPHSTNGAPNGMSVDKKVWNKELPSEEEQMRMITEMDSDNAWSTVAKGGKSKKKSSATTPANKETDQSSGNPKKDIPSATTAVSSATSTADNKDKSRANSNKIKPTLSTMPAPSADHNNTISSGAVEEDVSAGGKTVKKGNLDKTATSHRNDSNSKSTPSKTLDSQESQHVKATYETIDHSVWTRENITDHPDYDPDFPYALTGHPDDDEWAVC